MPFESDEGLGRTIGTKCRVIISYLVSVAIITMSRIRLSSLILETEKQ